MTIANKTFPNNYSMTVQKGQFTTANVQGKTFQYLVQSTKNGCLASTHYCEDEMGLVSAITDIASRPVAEPSIWTV
jgi:hypothetical protein